MGKRLPRASVAYDAAPIAALATTPGRRRPPKDRSDATPHSTRLTVPPPWAIARNCAARTAETSKGSFAVSAVRAAQLLAIAQRGGPVRPVLWARAWARSSGGRRRPGVVASAAIGALSYATLALGSHLPVWLAYPLAFVAGAGAFGWVGLYFALVAEIGGPRHAGLLTGAATACAWSGTLIGPPIFGLVLEATGSYAAPWLILTAVALAVVLTLPRLSPLVQRG